MNCKVCGGKGWVQTDKGIRECACVGKARLGAYLKPVLALLEDQSNARANYDKAKALENKTQAVLRDDRNIIGLMKMIQACWMPGGYEVVSVQELNAIEFGRIDEVRSINSLITRTPRLIVDMRLVNKKRDPKMREFDEQILTELVRLSSITRGSTIIILLPPTLNAIGSAYPGLFEALNALGVFYNNKGTIERFPVRASED